MMQLNKAGSEKEVFSGHTRDSGMRRTWGLYQHNTPPMGHKEGTPQVQSTFLVVLFGIVSGFSFGYNQGIITLAKSYVLQEFDINESVSQLFDGLVVASLLVGGMIGSLGGGIFVVRYGRRVANLIGCGLCIFGITSALAPHIVIFLIFRVFLGAGLGLTAVVCPSYVSDMAEANLRATLGVVFQIFVCVGIFVSFLVGWALTITSYVLDDSYRWRLMIGIGVLFPLGLFVQTWVYMLPESTEVDFEDAQMINGNETPSKPGFFNMLFGFPVDTLTATILAATLQLTGINAVMFYGPDILKKAGFSNGNLLNLGVGGWNFATTLVAVLLVKKMGRKALMVIGTAIMTLSLIGIGITFAVTDEQACNMTTTPPDKQTTCPRAIGVSVSLAAFLLGFEAGPGCLFWVLANEIFVKPYNDVGASYTNIAQWAFNLVVSFAFPSIPPIVAFFGFGGIGVICTVYLAIVLKEPRVVTL